MIAVRLASLAFACAAIPAAQAQTLFKCVGKDGKVTYQSEKCRDATRESTVRPPDPLPSRPVITETPSALKAIREPERAPAEPVVEWETFVAQISGYENCAAVVPGFASKHKANFDRWKERHRTAVAKFNQDGDAQRRVRESTEYVRGKMNARSPEERQYDAENCETRIAAGFAPAQAPVSPVPQNPPTSTPTKN